MSASILKGASDEFNVHQTVKVYNDNRSHIKVPCQFRFRRPNREQLSEIGREINDALVKQNYNRIAEILREYLIGWTMTGNDGQAVDFTDDNVDAVLDHPDYLTGLIEAFATVLNPAGKAKN